MKAEVPLREKLSLYWLARHKPYLLVIASGVMLGIAFPPFPFFFLIFVAFVPLFFLMEAIPPKVPEDKVVLPFKKVLLPAWRFLVTPFRILAEWKQWKKELEQSRAEGQGRIHAFRKFLGYNREFISGNAQLFRYTYITFFIWNLIGCYWLSFTVQGAGNAYEIFIYLIAGLLAVVLNPFLMALPFQFFSRIRHQFTPVLAAALAGIFWLGFEYLHFRWELSWAWLTLGHSLAKVPALIQFIEFTGVAGLTVYIWGANVWIYFALRGLREKRFWFPSLAAVIWILLPLMLNPILLNPKRAVFQPVGELNVRVVQPNIDPYTTKFDGTTFSEQVKGFVRQMESEPLDSIDLVILPETAIPRPVYHNRILNDLLIQPLWDITRYYDLSLLTGIMEIREYQPQEEEVPVNAWMERIRISENEEGVKDTVEIWVDQCNAALLLHDSLTFSTYQKSKLIPMVERTPWLKELSFLRYLGIDMGGGFVNLGIPDSLSLLSLPDSTQLGMMICYESEYGDFVRKQTRAGANLLVIITNDGWWGHSSGPVQHASFATLRAIENRRAVARSANTGISLFVDPSGQITQSTESWEPALIDQTLPLYNTQTFYVRNEDFLGPIALGSAILIILIALVLRTINRHSKPEPEP